ncbi:hypothetical protein DFJ73DRAFT_957213, partial [Zopfochytrium polystomum]
MVDVSLLSWLFITSAIHAAAAILSLFWVSLYRSFVIHRDKTPPHWELVTFGGIDAVGKLVLIAAYAGLSVNSTVSSRLTFYTLISLEVIVCIVVVTFTISVLVYNALSKFAKIRRWNAVMEPKIQHKSLLRSVLDAVVVASASVLFWGFIRHPFAQRWFGPHSRTLQGWIARCATVAAAMRASVAVLITVLVRPSEIGIGVYTLSVSCLIMTLAGVLSEASTFYALSHYGGFDRTPDFHPVATTEAADEHRSIAEAVAGTSGLEADLSRRADPSEIAFTNWSEALPKSFGYLTPVKMMGRKAELERILSPVRDMVSGETNRMTWGFLVESLPGMGKQTLMTACARHLEEMNVLVARASPQFRGFQPSFSVLHDLITYLFDLLELGRTPAEREQSLLELQLPEEVEGLLPLIGLFLDCNLQPTLPSVMQLEQSSLFAALAGILLDIITTRAGESCRAVAFIVDDIQKCDPISLKVLTSIISSGKMFSIPVVVILTRNTNATGPFSVDSDEIPSQCFETIPLSPISPGDGIGIMDANPVAADIPLSVKEGIVDASGGNPLIISRLSELYMVTTTGKLTNWFLNQRNQEFMYGEQSSATPQQFGEMLTGTNTFVLLDRMFLSLSVGEQTFLSLLSIEQGELPLDLSCYLHMNVNNATAESFRELLSVMMAKTIMHRVDTKHGPIIRWNHDSSWEAGYARMTISKRYAAHAIAAKFYATKLRNTETKSRDVADILKLAFHLENSNAKDFAVLYYAFAADHGSNGCNRLVRRDIANYAKTVETMGKAKYNGASKHYLNNLTRGSLDYLLAVSSSTLCPSDHVNELNEHGTVFARDAISVAPVSVSEFGWTLLCWLLLSRLKLDNPINTERFVNPQAIYQDVPDAASATYVDNDATFAVTVGREGDIHTSLDDDPDDVSQVLDQDDEAILPAAARQLSAIPEPLKRPSVSTAPTELSMGIMAGGCFESLMSCNPSVLRLAGTLLPGITAVRALGSESPSFAKSKYCYLLAIAMLEGCGGTPADLLVAYAHLQFLLASGKKPNGGRTRLRVALLRRGRNLIGAMDAEWLVRCRGSVTFFEGMLGYSFGIAGDFERAEVFLRCALVFGGPLVWSYPLLEVHVWYVLTLVEGGRFEDAYHSIADARGRYQESSSNDTTATLVFQTLEVVLFSFTNKDRMMEIEGICESTITRLINLRKCERHRPISFLDILALAAVACYLSRQGNLSKTVHLIALLWRADQDCDQTRVTAETSLTEVDDPEHLHKKAQGAFRTKKGCGARCEGCSQQFDGSVLDPDNLPRSGALVGINALWVPGMATALSLLLQAAVRSLCLLRSNKTHNGPTQPLAAGDKLRLKLEDEMGEGG